MSAITTFLQSEQALKILGLPGLALLLAFVFYRTLLANKLVRPLARNQSFVVLILIIVYFSVVSVLLIWVYRPERGIDAAPAAAPPQVAGKIEEPGTWSKVNDFLDKVEMDTPLATFDQALGPATGDRAIDPRTTTLRKRSYFTLDEGVVVTVGHDDRSVQWIAAFDNAQKLRIATLNLGEAQEDNSIRRYDRLSDIDLDFLAQHCDGAKLVTPGRGGMFAVTPCYFGRPGGYNYFAFLFMAGGHKSPFAGDCSPLALDDSELTPDRVRQCKAGKERPFGFIVASEDPLLPTAVLTFIDTLEN
jgi:hypothetical protein